MPILTEAQINSPIRSAFGLLWNLNFKAMPMALIWAAGLVMSLQTRSFVVRLIVILLCGVASVVQGNLIQRHLAPRSVHGVVKLLQDRISIATLLISSLFFAIALENVNRYSHSGRVTQLLMVANFVTVLVLWLFAQVVVLPIRLSNELQVSGKETLAAALRYVRDEKKSLSITMLTLLLGWPLFFFYFLLALTFAQSMTLSTLAKEDRPLLVN
jgi:hypothetical protein